MATAMMVGQVPSTTCVLVELIVRIVEHVASARTRADMRAMEIVTTAVQAPNFLHAQEALIASTAVPVLKSPPPLLLHLRGRQLVAT
jgi:hypothetical protein